VIQKYGLNFVRLYFLNYTWSVEIKMATMRHKILRL